MQTLKAAEESCGQQYSLSVFSIFLHWQSKGHQLQGSYWRRKGGEEVQYSGDTVEKSCINLMFGSTVDWEAEKAPAPFQPADKIINSFLLAALHNSGQQC